MNSLLPNLTPLYPQQQMQQLYSPQQAPQQHQQQQQPQPVVAAPTPLDAHAITIKLATLAGERFKDVFYSVFDSHRTDLHRFFIPQSVLVWEGTPAQGNAMCKALFEMLPSSKHTIQSFDVQPVTGGSELRGTVNTLVVTVTGVVQWGMSGSETAQTPNGFFHSFVLERSQASGSSGRQVHHIIQASMRTRFIEEESSSSSGHTGGGQALRKKRNYGR